ncbi:MAG: response regulator [Roseiflexaceae bacterium]|nr:response regulator [Roseiflexaceae bacterium]
MANTILIVEDDEMNRDMMARHLKWDGYEIITAGNGVQAVALAQSEAIDLILMDMGLPIMSGWEATKRLKKAAETKAIPIIALTAYVLTDERTRCLAIGCDEYEGKPIDFPRLVSKIQRCIVQASRTSSQEDATR